MLHVTIMAGGSGTRFWPASRRALPKQLLNLVGGESMLMATVRRLEGLCPPEQITVFTNESLAAATRQQLDDARIGIVSEPAKRDTAPCVALAAALACSADPDAVMLMLPADHVIEPTATFQAAVGQAVRWVEEDSRQLLTLGIAPTYPAEIYGYIERGELVSGGEGATYRVRQFREKPTAAVAAEFLKQRTFYWNAGIFVFAARTMLEALRQFEPDTMEMIDRIIAHPDSETFEQSLMKWFPQIPAKSIDYAVLERYPHVMVIEAPFHWDDVGSWLSLERLSGKDPDGNTIDAARYIGLGTTGSIIRSTTDHLVVAVGVRDLIIVHTPDATLVANKRDEAALRQIVQEIEARGWTEYL
ncbi:MAG TPA: sugar phosphate nucleotidyltransferase [Pirellulaceae bacterium]|nr:sugar phosphate nucleotidyltransferase [Pirellulaceae bacterium]